MWRSAAAGLSSPGAAAAGPTLGAGAVAVARPASGVAPPAPAADRGSPRGSSAPEETDALRHLVASARAGDAHARERLLGAVLQLAHRYARARLGTYPAAAEVAADVAQEVGMAVLTALPTYDDRGAPFEAFVYRVASRKVADAQRAHARGPVPTDHVASAVFDSEVASAETHVVARDEASRAWAMLETLSDRHREVLVLRVGVGLSAAETADALGMTPGGVRVAQHRALGELRARWQGAAS
jgi:RNA polymerase sigma-70 factor, ECF subfamily